MCIYIYICINVIYIYIYMYKCIYIYIYIIVLYIYKVDRGGLLKTDPWNREPCCEESSDISGFDHCSLEHCEYNWMVYRNKHPSRSGVSTSNVSVEIIRT